MSFRSVALALMVASTAIAAAQETAKLTLDEALKLAQERNGTLRAARLSVIAADASAKQAYGAFLPTLTPSLQYENRRFETMFGGSKQTSTIDETSTNIALNWRALDNGARSFTYRAARRSLEAQALTATQTLRQTLFNVHQRYYETLRTTELERVAQLQVDRAQKVLLQTEARVETKDAPRKDILQARADLLNAQVQLINARNDSSIARTSLRAILGLTPAEPLSVSVGVGEIEAPAPLAPLEELVAEGLANRADLNGQRRLLEADRFGLERARRDSILDFGVDFGVSQSLTPDSLNDRRFTVLLSIPLYDGNIGRERVRQLKAGLQANEADLVQAERNARAEIEAAANSYQFDYERYVAARAAVDAARANYDAALESQRLGASDLVEVLTAQVSLATAESNAIQAAFDAVISRVGLQLVLGRPIRGENLP